MKKQFLLFILTLSSLYILRSQPITLEVLVAPPIAANVSDYLDQSVIKITNSTNLPISIMLKGSLSSDNGISASTKSGYKPPIPIIVPANNQPLILQATKANASYMDIKNIDYTTGAYKLADIARTGVIPEGSYTLCINAYDYTTGEVKSKDGAGFNCRTFNIIVPQPPTIDCDINTPTLNGVQPLTVGAVQNEPINVAPIVAPQTTVISNAPVVTQTNGQAAASQNEQFALGRMATPQTPVQSAPVLAQPAISNTAALKNKVQQTATQQAQVAVNVQKVQTPVITQSIQTDILQEQTRANVLKIQAETVAQTVQPAPTFIRFSWLPTSARGVIVAYDLYLLKLIDGQNGQDALLAAIKNRQNNPIKFSDIRTPQYDAILATTPSLVAGRYAWAVVAKDGGGGQTQFENNGISAVCEFEWKPSFKINLINIVKTLLPPPTNCNIVYPYNGSKLPQIEGGTFIIPCLTEAARIMYKSKGCVFPDSVPEYENDRELATLNNTANYLRTFYLPNDNNYSSYRYDCGVIATANSRISEIEKRATISDPDTRYNECGQLRAWYIALYNMNLKCNTGTKNGTGTNLDITSPVITKDLGLVVIDKNIYAEKPTKSGIVFPYNGTQLNGMPKTIVIPPLSDGDKALLKKLGCENVSAIQDKIDPQLAQIIADILKGWYALPTQEAKCAAAHEWYENMKSTENNGEGECVWYRLSQILLYNIDFDYVKTCVKSYTSSIVDGFTRPYLGGLGIDFAKKLDVKVNGGLKTLGASSDIIYPTNGSKLSGIPGGTFAVPRMSLDDVFQSKGCKQKDELAAWAVDLIARLLATWNASSTTDKCAEIEKRKQNIEAAKAKTTWSEVDCAGYQTDRIMLNNMDASICGKPIDLIELKSSLGKAVDLGGGNYGVKVGAKESTITMGKIQRIGDCNLYGWIDYEVFDGSIALSNENLYSGSETFLLGNNAGYEINISLASYKITPNGYYKIWFWLNDYDKWPNSNDYFHMEGGCNTKGQHNNGGHYYAIVKFSDIPATGELTKTFTFCENGCNSCAGKSDKAVITFYFAKK